MTYEYLVSCLGSYRSRECARTGEDIRVQAAQLIEGQYSLNGETYYNSDFIFVGYVSELPEDPLKAPHDAVCIEDVPVPAAYQGNSCMNLVLVEAGTDLMQLLNRVIFNLADDTRILNHNLFFAELDREAVTLSGIMELSYQRLHNPLLLVSANRRVIAYSRQARFFPVEVSTAIREGQLSETLMHLANNGNIYPFYEQEGSVNYALQIPPGESWCVLPVEVHGFTIAWLMMVNAESMFFNSDFFFIQRLKEVLGQLMEGEEDLYSDQGLMHSTLFVDLITGGGDPALLSERIRFLGWKFTDSMYLLRTREQGTENMELISSVLKLLPSSRYVVYGGELVMLLKLSDEEYREKTKALAELLKKTGRQGMLSGRFSGPQAMKDRYHQTKHMEELCMRFGISAPLQTYERWSVYFLAEAAYENLTPEDYIPSGFRTLVDYDEQHQAGLIDTLELYLLYGGLPQEAVSELCVSKSTAYYRLSKIKELTRLDLENGAVRLQLSVATAAYRLYS